MPHPATQKASLHATLEQCNMASSLICKQKIIK